MQNSVFCRMLLWLFGAVQESAVLRCIVFCVRRLCSFLGGVLGGSVAFRWISTVLGVIGRVFAGSVFGRVLCRKDCIDDYTDSSAFYRCVNAIRKKVVGCFASVTAVFCRINSGSLNEKLYRKALGRFSWFRLETLLTAAVFLIFIIPHEMWNNLYAAVLAVCLAAGYFLRVVRDRGDVERTGASLWFPLLFFIITVFAGVIGSYAPGDSVRVLIFFVTAFLLCIVVKGTLTGYDRMDFFLRGIVLVLLATGIYAGVQWALGVEVDILLADMNLNKGMPGRVFGTLGNPNNFAEFLMLFIPFAFAFTLNQEEKGWKAAGSVSLIVSVVALVLTYSRSGWIAFAIAAVVFVALYDRKYLPALILVAILCIPLLPESVMDRILTIGNLEDTSSSYRLDIWSGSLEMLRDGYWLTGTGLGAEAFTSVYPAYGVSGATGAPHTHMQFMEMMAELGILGFLSLLWYSISLSRRTAVATTGKTSRKVRNILCAAAASMAGITAIGFAEYTWFYPRVMLAFFIAAGMAMAAVHVAGAEEQGKPE